MSIETFFRGRLDAAARMGDVQRQVEARLPDLFVPHVRHGEAVALRPYQLRDEEGTRSLALSFNQATFVAFEYPGHEAFIAEALEMLRVALGLMGVEELTRIAFRYDNAFDLPRSEGRGSARGGGAAPCALAGRRRDPGPLHRVDVGLASRRPRRQALSGG